VVKRGIPNAPAFPEMQNPKDRVLNLPSNARYDRVPNYY
jgi:hypothetical protein